MSTMRELTIAELDIVSGGCGGWQPQHSGGCHPAPSCGSQVSLSGMIGAYAGYLAGMYNVGADYFNHASCSTIASAWQNVGADMKLGYSTTASMSVKDAMSFLQSTISSIQGAQSWGNCGCLLAENTISFPASSGGGFG
ncbi:hypothetical protein [Acetobacter estunensis]|uniref:hypothetical protein n=1 Tax=Acetobacter estunensis TaxID=104097 RepID=UPI001C2DB0C2|nr:hypothetical protein [Acetobacter estunensis]MBV1837807.1 hypothetical protein [Acetobacter estunensis]